MKDPPRGAQVDNVRRLLRPLVLRLYAWKQDWLVFLVPAMARYHRLPLVGRFLRRLATIYARTTYHTGRVAPYEEVRALIMQGEGYAAAVCACRKVWKHCDVTAMPPTCLYVGLAAETWVKFKKPDAKEIDRTEALRLLDRCRDMHLVHTIWTCTTADTYAICSCCPVDCAGMQLRRAGIPEGSQPSSYLSQTDPDLCDACGDCVDFCHTYPFGARNLVGGLVEVDESRCVGCGVCRDVCTRGAIDLRPCRYAV
ncbi:MAG: 4Fe-4S binding protein [Dehalococcoidia bacterium]|nr:4Fe-4S binding protein [Dehalococcoidia bacterium]